MMCAGDNQALAGKAGAIEALVSALQTHSRDVGAVTAACKALQNLSTNGKMTISVSVARTLQHDGTAVHLYPHLLSAHDKAAAVVANHDMCRGQSGPCR